jgi:hypothetical protein
LSSFCKLQHLVICKKASGKSPTALHFFALGFKGIEYKLKKMQGGRAQKTMLVY